MESSSQCMALQQTVERSARLTPMRVRVDMAQALDTTQEPEMAVQIQVGGQ